MVLRSIAAPAMFYRGEFAAGWKAAEEALRLSPAKHERRPLCVAWRACVAMQLGKSDEVDDIVRAQPRAADQVEHGDGLGYAIATACTPWVYAAPIRSRTSRCCTSFGALRLRSPFLDEVPAVHSARGRVGTTRRGRARSGG